MEKTEEPYCLVCTDPNGNGLILKVPLENDAEIVGYVKQIACSAWDIKDVQAYHLKCVSPENTGPLLDESPIPLNPPHVFVLACHKGEDVVAFEVLHAPSKGKKSFVTYLKEKLPDASLTGVDENKDCIRYSVNAPFFDKNEKIFRDFKPAPKQVAYYGQDKYEIFFSK